MVVYSDFLIANLWWIVALGVLFILLLCLFIEHLKEKSSSKKPKKVNSSLYLEALGGSANIISKSLEGSRIVVKLNDYEAINRDKLRDAGVNGFILMSDKLTLVIKKDAKEVYQKIFPNE
jgi:phosphotransferase system IIB component